MSDGRYERVNTEENEPVISGVRGSYAVARVEEVPYEARAVRQENVPEKQPDRVVILGVDVEHVKTQVQRLFSWISARARPLAEFLKFENLNVPNPVVAVERIRINLQKFYYNYVGLFVGGAAVCVLYHPFSTAVFAFVAYWVYGKKKRPVASGYTVPVVIVGLMTGLVGHVLSAVALCSAASLAHAALMVPSIEDIPPQQQAQRATSVEQVD
eukprot:CAMPEP_0113956726 /NCGR_PEP_ID=MMETSP0011_2-20120614/2247_1 /TAXON_ID=101924 /ORGANISM="Rhodosorus marinus" /LENGTH=212 /DNA_ID=CAMNT_0000966955 /DNA_START=56 /DNA_END=694 /DNA_ORIENTATION=- /assembly_acc=CAM_ASM_000156